ncbi:hypothetical protein FKM82_029065 [Ascaphus truei]
MAASRVPSESSTIALFLRSASTCTETRHLLVNGFHFLHCTPHTGVTRQKEARFSHLPTFRSHGGSSHGSQTWAGG